MARKRVIAYVMHEEEITFASNVMDPVAQTESYVIGEVDEAGIAALREHGLIVEIVDEGAAQETAGTSPVWARAVVVPALPAMDEAGDAAVPPPPAMDDAIGAPPEMAEAPEAPGYYLAWLSGPLLEQWRAQLEDAGARIVERYPNGAAKLRLEADQVASVAQLPFVRDVRAVDADDAGPQFAAATRTRPAGDALASGRRMLTFDIRLNRPEDADDVLRWLQQRGIAMAGANARKIRVYLLEDAAEIAEIPALPGVGSFEQYVPPKLHNDVARRLLSIDAAGGAAAVDQTGAGQIVAVADTGLDQTHPDFAGRVVAVIALGRPTASDDPHGHGTHVAGSVLGDGSASGGQFRGVAPGARLFFQSLLDAGGGLGGLPFDLGDLFEEAWQAGARIHNNSWGAETESRYTLSSAEVDEFVARRRDMLVVISAGNEGSGAEPVNAALGFVDWLSIGSPASCKNALTVGASRSDRSNGGMSQLDYGTAWPNDFPHPPISAEKVSGDPECLAAFSSRGPCDDRRIKPDLVAPGTDIVSTRSVLAPLRQFWGAVSGNPHYAFMGGTSMSAPLVAGCAALVREYYLDTRQHPPSAALLKATLINGATWLGGDDALAPRPGRPNYHQGFGRVDMSATLPRAANASLVLAFEDEWQAPGSGFTATGQRRRYQLVVAPGNTTLRICLAYTDHPARGVQNNLNLFVQRPDGSKVMGNAELPDSLNIPDPDNNVEVVRFDHAEPGTYLLQVSATNLLKPPQDFALVVTGDAITSFTRI